MHEMFTRCLFKTAFCFGQFWDKDKQKENKEIFDTSQNQFSDLFLVSIILRYYYLYITEKIHFKLHKNRIREYLLFFSISFLTQISGSSSKRKLFNAIIYFQTKYNYTISMPYTTVAQEWSILRRFFFFHARNSYKQTLYVSI